MATVTVHIPNQDPKSFTDDFAKKARKKARKFIREHDLSIKEASIAGEGTANVVITFPTQTQAPAAVTEEIVEAVLEDQDAQEDQLFEDDDND